MIQDLEEKVGASFQPRLDAELVRAYIGCYLVLSPKSRPKIRLEICRDLGWNCEGVKRYFYFPCYKENLPHTLPKSMYYHLFQELADVIHERLRKVSLEGAIVKRKFVRKLESDFPLDSEKIYS